MLIYSRPVPSRPAQIKGEPAAPDQVDLTAGSAWKTGLQAMTVLSDSEAAAIAASAGGQAAGLVGDALASVLGDAGLTGSAAHVLQGGGNQTGGALAAMHGALGTAGSVISGAVGAAVSQGRN